MENTKMTKKNAINGLSTYFFHHAYIIIRIFGATKHWVCRWDHTSIFLVLEFCFSHRSKIFFDSNCFGKYYKRGSVPFETVRHNCELSLSPCEYLIKCKFCYIFFWNLLEFLKLIINFLDYSYICLFKLAFCTVKFISSSLKRSRSFFVQFVVEK